MSIFCPLKDQNKQFRSIRMIPQPQLNSVRSPTFVMWSWLNMSIIAFLIQGLSNKNCNPNWNGNFVLPGTYYTINPTHIYTRRHNTSPWRSNSDNSTFWNSLILCCHMVLDHIFYYPVIHCIVGLLSLYTNHFSLCFTTHLPYAISIHYKIFLFITSHHIIRYLKDVQRLILFQAQ